MRLVLVYDWVIIFVLVLSPRGRGSMHGILHGGVSMSGRSNYQTESVVLNTRLKRMILFVAGSWEGRAILDKEWVSSKGVDKLQNFSKRSLAAHPCLT